MTFFADYLEVENALSNLLRFRQPVVFGQPVASFLDAGPEVPDNSLLFLQDVSLTLGRGGGGARRATFHFFRALATEGVYY